MAFRKISNGTTNKAKISSSATGRPRGRPFKVKNPEQLGNDVFITSGHAICNEGGIIKDVVNYHDSKPENKLENPLNGLGNLILDSSDMIIRENLQTNKEATQIECIKFTNGQNVLTIKFMQNYNRTYRIQMFLNEKIEIRNATYTGHSMAHNFWDLLKMSLK